MEDWPIHERRRRPQPSLLYASLIVPVYLHPLTLRRRNPTSPLEKQICNMVTQLDSTDCWGTLTVVERLHDGQLEEGDRTPLIKNVITIGRFEGIAYSTHFLQEVPISIYLSICKNLDIGIMEIRKLLVDDLKICLSNRKSARLISSSPRFSLAIFYLLLELCCRPPKPFPNVN